MAKCLVFLIILLAFTFTPGRAQVTCKSASINGTPITIISVNMNDKKIKVTPLLASRFPGGAERFPSMISRTKPTAAINGTFFSKETLNPVGDIVIDGAIHYFGGFGIAMAITPDNQVRFIKVIRDHRMNWQGYETVIACGPRLIKDGAIHLDARGDGFRDPHVLGAGSRSAVGLTATNQLLFVSIPSTITLESLAGIMKSLGCAEAMNLDGGASTAMYYRGNYPVSAGRNLTNIIEIFEAFGERQSMGEPKSITDEKQVISNSPSAQDHMKKLNSNLSNRDREALMRSTAREESPVSTYQKLALAQIKRNDLAGAADSYAEVARIYYDRGSYDISMSYATMALKLAPGNEKAKRYYTLAKKEEKQ